MAPARASSHLESVISTQRKRIDAAKAKTHPEMQGWEKAIGTVLLSCTSMSEVIKVHFEDHDVRESIVFRLALSNLSFIQTSLRDSILGHSSGASTKHTWSKLRKDVAGLVEDDIPDVRTSLNNLHDLVSHVETSKPGFKPGLLERLSKDQIVLAIRQAECRHKLGALHGKLDSITRGWKMTV